MKIPREKNSKFLGMFLLILEQLQQHETQGCPYRSEVILFGHIDPQRKLLLAIGNISEVHFQECGKYF